MAKALPTLLVIVALAILSCYCKKGTTTNSQVGETIDLSSSLESYEVLPLSSIASGIDYVILENSPEAYFRGETSNSYDKLYKIYDNIILITDGEKLVSFDLTGRILRQYGALGRGPGEFIDISDFTVNPETREVLILSAGLRKVFIYDFEGRHIRNIDIDFDPFSMRILGDKLFFSTPNRLRASASNHVIVITDFNGKRVNELLNRPEPNEIVGYGNKGFFGAQVSTIIKNRYYFWANIYDTIYSFNENFEGITLYPINLGKDRIPQDYLTTDKYNSLTLSELKKYTQNQNLLISDKYYFFDVFNKGGLARIVVFRDSLKSYNLHYIDDSTNKVRKAFQNDLDNLMHFWPLGTLSSNMLVGFAHGATLRPYLEKENQNINDETSAGKLKNHLSDPLFDESVILIMVTLK